MGNKVQRVCSCTNSTPKWESLSSHLEARFTIQAHVGTQVDAETAMW